MINKLFITYLMAYAGQLRDKSWNELDFISLLPHQGSSYWTSVASTVVVGKLEKTQIGSSIVTPLWQDQISSSHEV